LDLDPVVTIEEEKFIELLIQTYGKILFQYFIVVFTFIEQIQDEIDNPINERNIPVLKSLLEQCNIRYIAVNSNSNSEEKEIFLRKLMKIQKVVVVTGFWPSLKRKSNDFKTRFVFFHNYQSQTEKAIFIRSFNW